MTDDRRTSLPVADAVGAGGEPGGTDARRSWARAAARTAAWAVSPPVSGALLLACSVLVAIVAWRQVGHLFIDLEVYRQGGLAWLHSRPLYAHPFPDGHPGEFLPFIYPPFAALCFVPLAVAPPVPVTVAFTLGSAAALLVTVRVVGAAVCPGFRWGHAVWFGGAALALEPVWQTLSLGQINLYLMALVVLDVLAVRDRRRRGLLIGLAAAVKLTPAVFLLFLVAGRQWRAVGNAAAAFGVATGLALLVRPADSLTYWWRALGAPTRIGDLGYAGNQSLRGALHRLGWTDTVELTCWVATVALVLVAAVVALRRWRAAGDGAGPAELAGLVVLGLAGVLISPISWSHHWVWLVPAAAVLGHFAVRRRSVPLGVTVGLIVLVTVMPAHRLLPSQQHRELGWSPVQHLVGDTYLWLGLVLLAVLYWLSSTALRETGRRGARSTGGRGLA